MAPGSLIIIHPALLTVFSHPTPPFPATADKLIGYPCHTDIRESLGTGHASPSSVSGPVFRLLGQDFVFVVILSSLVGSHPLY